jgi:U4/U6 small nuclear ribonucleoprotein PRP3
VTKKPVDLAALKAKMAEAKRKTEEMKAAASSAAQAKPIVGSGDAGNYLASLAAPSPTLGTFPAPTSSAHARYLQEQQEKRARDQKKQQKTNTNVAPKAHDPVYDPRLKRAHTERKARPMVFLETGQLTKRAEEQQTKIEKLVEATQYKQKKVVLPESTGPTRPAPVTSINADWWDEPFLSLKPSSESSMEVDTATDGFDPSMLREDLVTLLIHHPVLSKPMAEAPEPPPRPAMLTPWQEKKLARQARQLAQQTRREEILLGIRPAEKGRVRISNMMKVYSDAITDPTLVEKRVRAELAEREGRHFARNAERQLTPEQRKAKEREKLKEDTSLSSTVAVFRILSFANPKNRFKVDSEVRKNNLSGAAVYSSDFVVLVVEGGPKSVARFTKKMLKKVPWTQPIPPARAPEPTDGEAPHREDKEDAPKKVYGKDIDPVDNLCHLVWRGEVVRRSFEEFRFTHPSRGARAYLESLGVVHYYDAAKNFTPNDAIVI